MGSRDVEAKAALRVAGGEQDVCVDAADGEGLVVGGGVVGWANVGGREGEADPGGLFVDHCGEGDVGLVVKDGCAGKLFKGLGAGDVVEVSVGDEDLSDGELMFGEEGEDVGDVVAGVDDDGFAGGGVAEDGAVAAEEAYGEGFADEGGGAGHGGFSVCW